ncbi:serine hydrolase [Nocardioides sp.]|uniref:serine hydrolase domain-containing protein n=1 Tax=Nocardioides sp. TaxID=35761 RepID=UPI002733257D|nr:serine hydrolase [Nocardioides sp.]MDP3892316.1 serine hydrolase [Nocardioides sp.]
MAHRSLVALALALTLGGGALGPATADDSPTTLPSGVGAVLPRTPIPAARHTTPLPRSSQNMPRRVPWGTGTLDVPGTSPDSLGLTQFLTRTRTRAFVVLHRGTLVHEWYADGIDRDTKLASWSVAKSMVALLAGQAVADGRLRLDTKLVDVIPELRVTSPLEGDAAYNRVTVRDLLDMTSGIESPEGYTLVDDPSALLEHPSLLITSFTGTYPLFVTPDVWSFAQTHRTMLFEPGTKGEYISHNSQLLGMVLEATYGEDLETLFRTRLWEPAGAQYPATWNVDRPGGTAKGFCCLNAAGRDFARLGQLVLDAGTPRSPVSRAWKERLLRPRAIRLYGGEWPYSTNFWHSPADAPRGTSRLDDASALGIFGQYIYVNDRTDTVIAKLSDYGIEQDEALTLRAMRHIATSFPGAPQTVSVKVQAPRSVRRGHQAILRVTALGEGRTRPRGLVRLTIGGKTTRVRLVRGRARILWTPRHLGEHRYVARYRPQSGFKQATTTGHIVVRRSQ